MAAKSYVRKWECLCAKVGVDLCSFHVMVEYKEKVAMFLGVSADQLLVKCLAFSDSRGRVVIKSAVAEVIEAST